MVSRRTRSWCFIFVLCPRKRPINGQWTPKTNLRRWSLFRAFYRFRKNGLWRKEYVLVRENVQAALDGRELPIVGDLFEQYPQIPPVKNNRGTAGIITPPVKNNTTPAK